MDKRGKAYQPGTFNATILKDAITREMRRATDRGTLRTKRDLMAKNLRDMFSVQAPARIPALAT